MVFIEHLTDLMLNLFEHYEVKSLVNRWVNKLLHIFYFTKFHQFEWSNHSCYDCDSSYKSW